MITNDVLCTSAEAFESVCVCVCVFSVGVPICGACIGEACEVKFVFVVSACGCKCSFQM